MTARDEFAAMVERHEANLRRLRRQLMIRIPVAIVLGLGVGLVLRAILL